ncbi:endopeptidase La [bacterium]|jgi:ATP-dependent Lon protease|nr:endopeptidase La [bacterium]MBT3581576.1 endopeptidase La [bacterium]MBT4552738.1 endopeptidase La [bacterium]MBT5988519.1 endopeptidase La [bacterium]
MSQPLLLPLLVNQKKIIFPSSVCQIETEIDFLENISPNSELLFIFNTNNKKLVSKEHHTTTIAIKAELIECLNKKESSSTLLLEGKKRVQLKKIIKNKNNLYTASYTEVKETNKNPQKSKELAHEILGLFKEYLDTTHKEDSGEALLSILDLRDLSGLTDIISSYLLISLEKKQILLEELDLTKRLEMLKAIITNEIENLKTTQKIENNIDEKVNSILEKEQREYWLKTKLKEIQTELDTSTTETPEIESYKNKINNLPLPPSGIAELHKELKKLAKLGADSYESGSIKVYLDFLLNLPWKKRDKSQISIAKVQNLLNKNHYGLDEVKQRILEYLATTKLSKTRSLSNILCLVGPPGVGKTSLVKSIAKSLNRQFVSVSLAGINDEAELRGHRRVYIGANPGKIIASLYKTKTANPVILLDELDKIATNFKGDPSSALLEILDPVQNKAFFDHYLQIPFNISEILFICTANNLSDIPEPLLNRLEIITITGYSFKEKIEVVKHYLLPKKLKEYGIKIPLKLSSNLIEYIILNYTSDSGIREIQRCLEKILRKISLKIVKGEKILKSFSKKNIRFYLGTPQIKTFTSTINQPGRSLALYNIGMVGNILPIESIFIPGKGEVIATGNIDFAVRETIKVAVSYLKQNAPNFNFPPNFFENKNLHIHFSNPDIIKMGNGWGLAIFASIFSAITKKVLPSNIAFAGDISLLGTVFPVNYLEQKIFTATQLGIKKVIIAEKNIEREKIKTPAKIELIGIKNLLELKNLI